MNEIIIVVEGEEADKTFLEHYIDYLQLKTPEIEVMQGNDPKENGSYKKGYISESRYYCYHRCR